MYRIYFASKLRHAGKWRKMNEELSFITAHARWLKHNSIETPDMPENATSFWLEDEQDVRDADFVIVYAAPEDHLRGALVEAGIALAVGVPVIVIGEHQDYGTWQYHPLVTRCTDFPAAWEFIKAHKPRAAWRRDYRN